MGARLKLNAAYLNGCLLIAAAAGILSGSGPIFLVALALAVGAALAEGGLRGPSGPRGPRHR